MWGDTGRLIFGRVFGLAYKEAYIRGAYIGGLLFGGLYSGFYGMLFHHRKMQKQNRAVTMALSVFQTM